MLEMWGCLGFQWQLPLPNTRSSAHVTVSNHMPIQPSIHSTFLFFKVKKKSVQCRGQKTTFWSWFSPSTGGSRAWDQVKACAARDFTR